MNIKAIKKERNALITYCTLDLLQKITVVILI